MEHKRDNYTKMNTVNTGLVCLARDVTYITERHI